MVFWALPGKSSVPQDLEILETERSRHRVCLDKFILNILKFRNLILIIRKEKFIASESCQYWGFGSCLICISLYWEMLGGSVLLVSLSGCRRQQGWHLATHRLWPGLVQLKQIFSNLNIEKSRPRDPWRNQKFLKMSSKDRPSLCFPRGAGGLMWGYTICKVPHNQIKTETMCLVSLPVWQGRAGSGAHLSCPPTLCQNFPLTQVVTESMLGVFGNKIRRLSNDTQRLDIDLGTKSYCGIRHGFPSNWPSVSS